MPKVIVSLDGVVIKEVQLTKGRTTVGRRPYNDIVIDNLAVSGEHAVIHMNTAGYGVEIEDLGSTNGTYVNAKAVKRQTLHDGDTVELGKYMIRFLQEAKGQGHGKTAPPMKPTDAKAQPAPNAPVSPVSLPAPLPVSAIIRVISGAATGREMPLHKVVTTIGKPGVTIAVITKRNQGFELAHVEGPETTQINGAPMGASPVPLKSGDRLKLAGTEMLFEQS